MPKPQALLLCDFAQVRDGLLFVSSGCITRIRSNVLSACVAVTLYLEPDELDRAHELRVIIKHVDTAQQLAEAVGALKVESGLELRPGEGLHVPFVLDFRGLALANEGQHDVQLHIDGSNSGLDLSFWVDLPGATTWDG